MTRHPPQPLDTQERALAAMLPRPPGRGEPTAEVDARLLAAAGAALQRQPGRQRPRRSWIAPISVAASLVLAVGLAWQLRPPPVPAVHEQASAAASAESDAMAVLAIEAPPVPESQKPSVPAPMVQAPAVAATTSPAEASGKRAAATVHPLEVADVAAVAAAPAPAPPPPAPPAVVVGEAGTLQQSSEPARAPPMAKARASETTRERSEASANATTQAADAAQRAAADASTLDSVSLADDPGDDVPPATADAPEVREAWLRRIGELLEQGKAGEAKASLNEFRRRYPDATLPPELRKLEP